MRPPCACTIERLIDSPMPRPSIFVLTKGGPQNTTQILSTLAYKLGLATGDLGNAAAISLYLFPVLAVSTYVQVRLMRRVWQW